MGVMGSVGGSGTDKSGLRPSNCGIKFSSTSDVGGMTKSGKEGLGTKLSGDLSGDGIAGGSERCKIWSARSDPSATTTLVSRYQWRPPSQQLQDPVVEFQVWQV